MPRPTSVIWDVGNVIVRWDPRTLYSKVFSDSTECDRFLTDVCTMAWHAPTDCGRSLADNCADLKAQHPKFSSQIDAWRLRWSEMFSGPIPETERAIAELHAKGVRQFALTNMSHETYEATFAMSPAFDLLDGRLISGLEGVMKPGPEIFKLACDRFEVGPHEALFIDDSAQNIATAKTMGFHVFQFKNAQDLQPALEGLGLL